MEYYEIEHRPSLLRLRGSGAAFASSYGAIRPVDLDPGETYTVDTGHVVAFEGATGFAVRRVGDAASSTPGGQSPVAEFEGPGRVWIQTRNVDSLLALLTRPESVVEPFTHPQ